MVINRTYAFVIPDLIWNPAMDTREKHWIPAFPAHSLPPEGLLRGAGMTMEEGWNDTQEHPCKGKRVGSVTNDESVAGW
jgi:hypothetical protein